MSEPHDPRIGVSAMPGGMRHGLIQVEPRGCPTPGACSALALQVENAKLREAGKTLLREWDKFTRYGSPLAKAANEGVNRARAAIEGTEA